MSDSATSGRRSEKEIFFEALEKNSPTERSAFLDGACGKEPVLRARVEALLADHFQQDAFMKEPAQEGDRPTLKLALAPEAAPAQMLGRYKLLEKIGEGGFGEVWMAEQREPVKRRVALKIIKLGMDSRQIVARFEAERQALAMMDHPNIAKIFDAGTTESPLTPSLSPGGGEGVRRTDEGAAGSQLSTPNPQLSAGRPYFVMELVRGIKITEYCDQNQLPTQERLRLFILVCQAIQHAHQKGIIHRDIKPSNILVTLHDGVPVPKVIDFGIAKATQQELTDKTVFTQFQQFIGTPAYISPEQAEMSGLDIDTRADIYSLGVLLYELLVGQTPFDANEMMQGGLDALRQIIREKEPLRPSTKLNTLQGDARTTAGKRRQTEVGKLMHQLRGDLDWIVMKCLEKDRTRRYDTANGLAMDILRHLNNEAVLACPPSAAYRFQKMVRRNKLAFAASIAIATVLVLGVIVSTWQAIRATQSKREAVEAQRKEGEQRQFAENNAREARQAEQKITRNLYFAEMNLAGNAAAEPGGISRIAGLTAKWLPEKGAADQRGWEWYYLRSLLHQEMFTLTGHTNSVLSVAWSLDGKRLASAGSGDRTIKVWDAAHGTNLLTLTNQTGGVSSVAWSPDGKRLASGSADKTIKVWDAAHGTNILTLPGHTERVGSVAWSLDGKRLASGCNDGTIKVWDAANGTNLLTFTNHKGQVTSVAWSRDGKYLASGSWDMTIKIWDSTSGNMIHSLTNHTYWVWSVAWSPDGKRLASASGDRNLMVWDAASGTLIHTLTGHAGMVRSVSWSPDGKRLVSASQDYTLGIWDAESGTNLASLTKRGHTFWVFSVAWSPDGKRLASGSEDKTIRVWDADSEETLTLRSPTSDHFAPAVAWSLDGKRLATANDDHTLRIWDAVSGTNTLILTNHTDRVKSVAWSPDGKHLASGSWDKMIKIWDADSGQVTHTLTNHTGWVYSVAWSPDGKRLASAATDATVRVWDWTSERLLHTLGGYSNGVHSVAWSPDGKRLASSSWDGSLKVWDPDSGQLTLDTRRAGPWMLSAKWSPDGKRLAAGNGDTLKVWDAANGTNIHTLRGHSGDVFSISWSSDGKRLASASQDNTVKVWDADSGEQILTLRGHTGGPQVAWSPDGKRLASSSGDGTVKIWDAGKGYALERK